MYTTERLLLRDYTDADFEAVHAYGSNPFVVRHMLWGPNTEEETRAFLQRAQASAKADPRDDYGFAIVLRETDRLIGGCGIMLRSPIHKDAEIGYCLHPDCWGQGYMPEAASELLRIGFEELNLHRIYARCHPDNRPSARVMEKIGMTYEGRLRESNWVKGAWWDYLYYAILEDEWKASRESRV